MLLNPLPEIMNGDFDKDSLVYINDTELCYSKEFPVDILDDLQNHNLQIYTGYYTSPTKGTKESPRIYLIGRGKKSGKFKFKVQGFYPYCYIKSKDGELKDYLGNRVEKIFFKGMEPRMVATFRDRRAKKGYPLPHEADILFVRRFLIDMHDNFKSTVPISPKVAILDVETDHPVSDNIIAFAINDMENPIIFESKYDTKFPSELVFNIMEHLRGYDLVTGWNIDFDIKAVEAELVEINKLLVYARNKYKYTKEVYIDELSMKERKYSREEIENLIELLIKNDYLKEENNTIVLGDKEFTPNLSDILASLDMLIISRKMRAMEIRGKWSLGNVGIQIASIDKVHIGSKKIRELTEEELMEYNIVDTIIPDIIDNVLGGIEAHVILSWSLQSVFDDVILPAVVNDIALIRAYHKAGIVLPSRSFIEKEDDPQYDAAEPDARPGIYDGIVLTDLCLSQDTEVLTPNGWKEYKDLKINDDIYSFNKDTLLIEKDKIYELTIKNYKGKMINFFGKHLDQLLTPNHRVIHQTQNRDKRLKGYKDWSDYKVDKAENIKLNCRIPISFPMKVKEDYNIRKEDLQILAWIITEGHKEKECKGIHITQSNPLYTNKIKQLLEKSSFKFKIAYREDKKYYDYYLNSENNLINKYFENEDIHLIPIWILEKLSPYQLKLFYDSLIDGDGHRYSDTYHTLRCYRYDNLQRFLHLCTLLGYISSISKRKTDAYITLPYNSNRVSSNGRRHVKITGKNKKIIDYNGTVWCPTTKNTFIIIKRNNKISITGNTHAYPWAVISKNISCETKDPNGENIIRWKNKEGIDKELRFNNNPSIFIDTLRDIMNERKKIKNQLKIELQGSDEYRRLKSIDFALKTQAAAFSHGIFGWANSRMRDYEVADAITAIVRNLITVIKESCDIIEKPWVYVHTDSCYIYANKEDQSGIVGYLNDIITDYSEGSLVMPTLEDKGFKTIGYIHSPARNIMISENNDIDNDETWEVTGMNFMRSEVPEELARMEIELIKMKMKKLDDKEIKLKLKDMIKNLVNIDNTRLGLIKPLSKPLKEYGRELLDGTHGALPGHINALLRAHDEYGFELEVGDKFMVLPVLSDEITGKRILKRKRIDMAFPIEEGMPSSYKIDYEYYLRSNLWGKIHLLFNMKPKDLEKEIMDEEMIKLFGLEEYNKKLIKEEKNV
jgi:DNA polymerase elongation subunit (family B)